MARGGTPSAISLLFFELEWNICFIIHQIHSPGGVLEDTYPTLKNLEVNCIRPIIIQNICIEKTCKIYNNLRELI